MVRKYSFQVSPSDYDKLSVRYYIDHGMLTKFSINYHARSEHWSGWKQIWRVDTADHGNSVLKGKAHFHQYYKTGKARIEELGDDLAGIFTNSLKYIQKNFKHVKQNYLLT